MNKEQCIKNPLGYEKISKLLKKYAVPSIIAMLVSALYNIVDQIFIGQGVGVLGNAATNIAFPLSTICIALGLLFGIGGSTRFSLELGAAKEDHAAKAVGNAISLLALSGVILCVVVVIFLKPLLIFFGATSDILDYAMTYTRITAFGMPLLIFSNGLGSIIRADGSPKYSMFSMLAGAIINTILDPLFIFGFHMGIAGAAWATIIGQFISCLFSLYYIKNFQHIRLTKSDMRLDLSYVKSIAALGAANCFNQLAMTIVQIVMNNTLKYYGGLSIYGAEIPLACAGIIAKVNMIFMSFIIGISQGTQPIIGFNYGAKNYRRVQDTYKLAVMIATVISIISFAVFQLFPRQIISVFGEGSEEYFIFSQRYFHIFLFFTFLNGIQPVTSNFFTSIGKSIKGVFLSLTRQIIFLLPLLVALPMIMGIDGVMYAGPVADGAAFLLAVIFIVKEMRLLHAKQLKENGEKEKES
ncbi:MAG: MATE family efflux transporter [Erysipelotrichaceae bacterium]|jgi:Na+-driven multidrug efflux pump|nr:MATE family efflux transporter [Erysipelotrichaceae bacterium]